MEKLIGKIVKPNDASWFAKVKFKYPCGGFNLTGYSNCGIIPNRVYQRSDFKILSSDDFDKLNSNDLRCLIRMRDNF